MAQIKDLERNNNFEFKCKFCGYNEHPICLTLHHVFPRHYFRPQPKFAREDRYFILCPICHILLHKGIFVGEGKEFIKNKIDYCELKYKDIRNIDNIIELCRMVYKLPPKDL